MGRGMAGRVPTGGFHFTWYRYTYLPCVLQLPESLALDFNPGAFGCQSRPSESLLPPNGAVATSSFAAAAAVARPKKKTAPGFLGDYQASAGRVKPCGGVLTLRRILVFNTLDPAAPNYISAFFRHHQSISSALRRSPTTTRDDDNDDDDADNSRLRKRHRTPGIATCSWPLPLCFFKLRPVFAGAAVQLLSALPPFPYDLDDMSSRRSRNVPATPRVISPSPDPDGSGPEQSSSSYSGPMTRSARRRLANLPQPALDEIDEDNSAASDVDPSRARTRSRSPVDPRTLRRKPASPAANGADSSAPKTNGHLTAKPSTSTVPNGQHLSPHDAGASLTPNGVWSWRDLSRSPSPLGLIPIHRRWRAFVHRHEVPRKALHVSIGFFVVWLYLSGTQTRDVCPYLMGALVPIAAVDVARHHYAPFNRLYVRVLGALMRESEYSGYNGVIFYLLGAWAVLYAFPKDVGVMGTLLLSWCDTAASTFGRLYGRYTPRIRKGKSLAGSAAAFVVGVATSVFFWGWLAPVKGPMPGDENFMFTGTLGLPARLATAIGLEPAVATISGGLALGAVSLWSGFVAAASEVVDLFGWDDNLTIPVLSGLGIWGFLKVFG
ncbi:hypothetical protein VTJ49DRAFT_5275 [Mycothermus thermophilus]|uniref:Phosphatidate cytidylyltransferase n=1 Tax=Humicola insolens TaxID=85995 RepID=A0ABR3VKR3_HUMIN